MKIANITNEFSTTNMTLPQFKNTDLEIGHTETTNKSIVKIRVPKLVHGPGSIIELGTFVNGSDPNAEGHVYAVFDQGSTIGGVIYSHPPSFNQLINQIFLEVTQGSLFTTYTYYFLLFGGFVAFQVYKRFSKKKSKDYKD
jgi:hypothetical protein